ncbi:hypothetical protein J6590_024804 [Homalodisca vitripennis]|nr:hypothetical protein J6590_024804 [Homalodisca vitripennis]
MFRPWSPCTVITATDTHAISRYVLRCFRHLIGQTDTSKPLGRIVEEIRMSLSTTGTVTVDSTLLVLGLCCTGESFKKFSN